MIYTDKIQIAFADDHVAVRKGIIAIIDSLGGFEIAIEASNGSELITKFEAAETKPGICLLDINMPVMNGFETLKALKNRWPETKVLAFTSFDSEVFIIRMIREGANGYLLKDCEPKELKAALMSVHKNGVYYSKQATCHFRNAIHQGLVRLPNLTDREAMLLKYTCTDLTYTEIAKAMKTTKGCVEGYRETLFRKLGVRSRVGLAIFAVQSGIVPMEHISSDNIL